MPRIFYISTILLILAVFGIFGVYKHMENTIRPLPEKWQILFKEKPEAITQYASNNPIHLKNVSIEDHDLSDSVIPNAVFENIEWSDSVAIDSKFINTKFLGGTVRNSGFSRSTFDHVIFQDVTFYNVEFIAATMLDVTFKNCKFYNSKLHSLHTSKITIEDSELRNVEFFESELDITLKNTTIIELGMFGGLKPGSRVTLEDSYIGPYSDFSSSNITSFKAVRSRLDRFALAGNIGEIVIIESYLDFSIGFSNIDRVTVRNPKIIRLAAGHGAIKIMTVENCNQGVLFDIREGKVGELSIRNCSLSKFRPLDTIFGKVNIANSMFVETKAQNIFAKELILHNVSFIGNTDFSGAQAVETEFFKVSFDPSAALNNAGSNIPFQQYPR